MAATPSHPESASLSVTYDVLIAGAGPVGLLLACELALANCSVLVLEQAAHPASPLKQLPFGMRGLNAPSIEALDRRGLLPALELELPQRLTAPHAAPAAPGKSPQAGGHFAGIQFQAGSVDFSQWPARLPSSTAPQLLVSLQALETVLARRAAALGVGIVRGAGITGVAQTADGVTAQAGGQSVSGRWLVGCDGGRSAVRKLGGFAFEGTEPEFTGYSARVDLADPEKLQPGRVVTTTGMYLQSQPGYLVLQEFDGGAAHRAGQPPTLDQVQQVLRRVSQTDATISALHLATTWTDRARQATTYRAGRVLLAGDAAHIHSPLGGQGLNLGLGDALNLGWKLAATIQQRAPAGLLDSYTAERHTLGAQVLEWSRAQVALMRPDPAAHALRAIVRDLLATRDGATYVAGRVWGMATHYPLGGSHPLVGYSTPNFELEDGTTANEHLRQGHGLLLDFEGSAALQALAHAYGPQLPYVAGRAKNQLGLQAALLRPDGVVAWATAGPAEPDEAAQAAARWFARLPTGAAER